MKQIAGDLAVAVLSAFIFLASVAAAGGEAKDAAINSLEEITLGGAKQWILIRGESAANPILLFLHGGPGHPEMPYAHLDSRELEKRFIVVNWDQRGAGKSCSDDVSADKMNIGQFLSDTHELVQILCERFAKDKIFLIGHSWGSVLGLRFAQRYPDLLYAYIGMGQVVSMKDGERISYKYVLQKAGEEGDGEAVAMLEQIGPPPYKGGFRSLGIQRSLLEKYGGATRRVSFTDLEELRKSSPFYTDADHEHFMPAFIQSNAFLWDELFEVDFFEEILEVQVPVYFFAGRCDYVTPFVLLERYFDMIKAPYKEIVWFENSCHMPNLDEPEIFQDKLINIVLKNTYDK